MYWGRNTDILSKQDRHQAEDRKRKKSMLSAAQLLNIQLLQ